MIRCTCKFNSSDALPVIMLSNLQALIIDRAHYYEIIIYLCIGVGKKQGENCAMAFPNEFNIIHSDVDLYST